MGQRRGQRKPERRSSCEVMKNWKRVDCRGQARTIGCTSHELAMQNRLGFLSFPGVNLEDSRGPKDLVIVFLYHILYSVATTVLKHCEN